MFVSMFIDLSYLAKYSGPKGRLVGVIQNWTEHRVRICYTSVYYSSGQNKVPTA